MQTCCRNTLVQRQVFSLWLSHWRTGGQGHHGPVGWALQIIQQANPIVVALFIENAFRGLLESYGDHLDIYWWFYGGKPHTFNGSLTKT